jgi:hypothetical protein
MPIEKEIKALKFLLRSYFGSPPENERIGLISTQFEETKNEHLLTYANLSQAELNEQLFSIRNCGNGE